jgi:organic hydroperoxide reductase OsmC/OhrA
MANSRESLFQSQVRWTGSYVPGQAGARSYTRDLEVEPAGKTPIRGSAGARFFGDESRYNPEDLMLASLAECHLLTYLALATKAGIRFETLSIQISGVLGSAAGKTRFVSATLTPQATFAAGSDETLAYALHREAHEQCFMSNSVNFPIQIVLPDAAPNAAAPAALPPESP